MLFLLVAVALLWITVSAQHFPWKPDPAKRSAQSVRAFTVDIAADESGNGLFTNTAGFSSNMPGLFKADTGPGGAASALFYDTFNPPGLVTGDLLITFDGGTEDVIRFSTPPGTTGGFFYYSVAGKCIADVGLPTAFQTNTLSIPSALSCAPTLYTPVAGQPGFVTGAGGPVTYDLQSCPKDCGGTE
jgi:hypothetical protein